jgi:hypothetical protein
MVQLYTLQFKSIGFQGEQKCKLAGTLYFLGSHMEREILSFRKSFHTISKNLKDQSCFAYM